MLAAVNNAAMGTGCYYLFEILIATLLGKYAEVGVLDRKVAGRLTF